MASRMHGRQTATGTACSCGLQGGDALLASVRRNCEDGESLHVEVWDNPCGHVDMYKDVLIEAGYLKRFYCPRLGCGVGGFPAYRARMDEQGRACCPRCGAPASPDEDD